MDGDHVKEWEARCIEEQPPACTAACPLHVDARAMLGKIAAGDFSGAFALYTRIVPFPAILSHICDHPCEPACRRGELGGSIGIRNLERALVEDAYATLRRSVMRNRKPKRVAVIGGGLAGLTAAFDLAMKGHGVTVFEAEGRLLDRLYTDYDETRLPRSAIAADIGQLAGLGIEIKLLSRVISGDGPLGIDYLIDAYDALLLAQGRGSLAYLAPSLALRDDGRVGITDPVSCATSQPKVFAAPVHDLPPGGGDHVPYSPIGSMHHGRRAALSVDRFLQGASLTANRTDEGSTTSRLHVNLARHEVAAPVEPLDPEKGYSREEAIAEAGRCLPCECKECVNACEYLKSYGAYPKRYVREIYNNDCIVMGNRKSNRMIDSCAMCGLCEEICPNDLSMADVCLEARQSMVARGKMPRSHHDFAMADMEFSRSEAAAFACHAPGTNASTHVFFPGCQLTGSSPASVEAVYAHLRLKLGDVGLMVDCCGAPAHWAGQVERHAVVVGDLRRKWEDLGRPVVVTACSTCLRMFADFLPEVRAESLWTVLTDVGWPGGVAGMPPGAPPVAIHDPCTSRGRDDVHAAVRDLAGRLGLEVRELAGADLTTCCGFGGLAQFANPELADRIVERRADEDDAAYLTYCAMCRDNFARRGKRALHILDVAFPSGDDPAARPDPGFSGRRDNRRQFKIGMLRRLWGVDMDEPQQGLSLVIGDDVKADMERKLILVSDVERVIAHAEATGERLQDSVTGRIVATLVTGHFTCWVEYEKEDDAYVVRRAYGHRMQVRSIS